MVLITALANLKILLTFMGAVKTSNCLADVDTRPFHSLWDDKLSLASLIRG